MVWTELHSRLAPLTGMGDAPPGWWAELYNQTLSLDAVIPPTEEWVELFSSLFPLRAEGVLPPPPPPPPSEAKKSSWVPVALIGGGVAIAAISIKPKKKKA